jgi:hypothetical protein
MEAIERYGVLRGGTMAAWRVLRCHPFAAGGLDAVKREADGCGSYFAQDDSSLG